MKKPSLKNLGLKLLSVVCAIILWLVVMNVSDSQITERIDDIPVQIVNGETLDQLDKIYDVQQGDTVSVIVKGKRTVVERLDKDDFTAIADLSKMSITDAVPIEVSANSTDVADEITLTCVDNTMILSLEDKISKQFPIKVNLNGDVKEGYAVAETTTTPNIITVEGPESAVNKITEVETTLNVSGASADVSSQNEIVLVDAYGEEITNERITVSQQTVTATAKIYPDKLIPVNVNLKGTPASGYEVAETVYEPKSICVTGDNDALANISSLEIDSISISGMSDNYETTVDITGLLPEGVSLAQSDGEVVISIDIEKTEEKTIELASNDISLKNMDTTKSYSIKLSDDFEISAKGLSENIEEIDESSLSAYIDCTGMTLGDNVVELKYKAVDNATINISGTVTVTVTSKSTK